MASSIYLQDEKWIMALLMAITLCLLVYSALDLSGGSAKAYRSKTSRFRIRRNIRLSARQPGGCFRSSMESTCYLVEIARLFST
jgi:hypothetical protein